MARHAAFVPLPEPFVVGVFLLALACAAESASLEPPSQERVRDLAASLADGMRVDGAVDPGRPGCAPLLGSGWHSPERSWDGMTYAWTSEKAAHLTLPVRRPGSGSVIVRGYALADGRAPRRLVLRVNGRALAERPVPAGMGELAFRVAAGILRAGDNDVALEMSRTVRPSEATGSADTRPLGLLVDYVRFVPDGAPNPRGEIDPYDASGAGHLGAESMIELRPSRLAGAELRLAWDGEGAAPSDSLAVELHADRTGTPLFVERWPAGPGMRQASVALPAGLPPKALLRLRLAGPRANLAGGSVRMTAAALVTDARPVNVVLIVIDTLRPDYLGCYGDRRGLSPAIDRLAKDGVLFESAISTAPITGPSHASLFTSRWPCEAGIVNNGVGRPSPALPTLAELLSDLDFRTDAAVSIWAVGRNQGFARGFDAYADDLGYSFLAPADTVVTRAIRQIAHVRSPFFLWAHFSEPHEPYDAHGLVDRKAELRLNGRTVARVSTSTYTPTAVELDLPPRPSRLRFTSLQPFHVRDLHVAGLDGPPPEFKPTKLPSKAVASHQVSIAADGARRVRVEFALADRIKLRETIRERYAREVASVDTRVGALLDELRRRGLYDDALIIFTSDHGEALGEHDLVGHVENLYDELVRVPLIVKPPRSDGAATAGSRRRDLASLVDILPTVLGVLGQPPLPNERGRDLLAPDAARAAPEAVFSETHAPQAQHTLYALRGDRYKIVLDADRQEWEFYDLKLDPQEKDNRYAAGGQNVRRWQELLETQLAEISRDNGGDKAPAAIDDKTRRMLRALGY